MKYSRHLVSALLLAAAAPFVVAPALGADAAPAVQANSIAENYAALLERDYVYPETGKRYAAALRDGIKAGRYRLLTGEALGAAIDADVRARTIYLAQIGYISMQVRESLAIRMARIPSYVGIYTGGLLPEPREIARFHASHGFTPEDDA